MIRWLKSARDLAMAIMLMPSVALATGTLVIPQTIAALAAGNQPASLLDQNWIAIRDYINAREITIDLAGNRPVAGIKGRYYFATDTNGGTLYNDTGTTWQQIAPSLVGSFAEALTGLTLANSATNPSTTIGIASGAASSDDAAIGSRVLMTLASAFTKTLAGAVTWVVGTGNSCLDIGTAAASTWYHLYLIQRVDTGVVDILCSTSATAPTMPTNYTKKRRIGSFVTSPGSEIVQFIEYPSREFYWATPPTLNVNTTNPGTAAVTATLATPLGIVSKAFLNVVMENTTSAAIAVYISSLDTADVAPQFAAAPLLSVGTTGVATPARQGGQVVVWTSTSSQIRYRLSASGAADTIRIGVIGWFDPMGRN